MYPNSNSNMYRNNVAQHVPQHVSAIANRDFEYPVSGVSAECIWLALNYYGMLK